MNDRDLPHTPRSPQALHQATKEMTLSFRHVMRNYTAPLLYTKVHKKSYGARVSIGFIREAGHGTETSYPLIKQTFRVKNDCDLVIFKTFLQQQAEIWPAKVGGSVGSSSDSDA